MLVAEARAGGSDGNVCDSGSSGDSDVDDNGGTEMDTTMAVLMHTVKDNNDDNDSDGITKDS